MIGNVGLDGKPRQLHIEESIKSLIINDLTPSPIRIQESCETLLDRPPLGSRLPYSLRAALSLPPQRNKPPPHTRPRRNGYRTNFWAVSALRGKRPTPYANAGTFVAQVPSKLLITDRF